MSIWAIIVAGGKGQRMGTAVPKQLLSIDGITILERSLKPFMECSDIDGIVIVGIDKIIEYCNNVFSRSSGLTRNITVVRGGTERQDSVWNGLMSVPADTEIVVIHDAVRPFIRKELISECILSAREHGAVSVMRPLKETVKVVADGVVITTPERSSLWITQTPQAFRTELIVKAHTLARNEGFTATDDSMLVERLGHPVHIIEGDDLNIKITTPADLKIASAILSYFENGEE